jgi:hypothetical protein
MAGRPSDLGPHHLERVTGIEPALSAWELDRWGGLRALTCEFEGPRVPATTSSSPRLIARQLQIAVTGRVVCRASHVRKLGPPAKHRQGLALRTRIVLACADGGSNVAVAARLRLNRAPWPSGGPGSWPGGARPFKWDHDRRPDHRPHLLLLLTHLRTSSLGSVNPSSGHLLSGCASARSETPSGFSWLPGREGPHRCR